MTRRILLAVPFLLWAVAGVILMTWLHVLPSWAWLLLLAPTAAIVGVLATYWETPAETYVRKWKRARRESLVRMATQREHPYRSPTQLRSG